MSEPATHQPSRMSNQQRRTRQAILIACRELLAAGVEPSMGNVAERALVGRATIYRYFPALKHLLFEASLANTEYDIDSVLADTAEIEDPEQRLRTVVEALYRRVRDNEASYRQLLQFSLGSSESGAHDPQQIRGVRRIRWLEEALAPYRGQFDEETIERLVQALSIVVGIEAVVALKDISGLGPDQVERVIVWSATALLRQALAEGS